jgi:hypothetical protein
MRTRIDIKTICTILVLSLVLVACSATVQTVVVTATTAPTTIIVPTATPKPTIQPTQALPKMVEYTHPSNSFSILVPEDWTSVGESAGGAMFSSPDQTGMVALQVENTGNVLNADEFTKAVDAFEINGFSPYKNYKQTNREIQTDKGYAIISKTMDMNAIPFQAATIFEQKGKVLYAETYISAVSAVSATGPIFTAMDNSFKSNPAYGEDLSPFTTITHLYADPNNLFSLKVPALWTYEDSQKNGSVITYTSPDSNAVIMLVKTDMGKAVTRALADTTALEMLKKMFSDVRIAKTEVLKNGSYQMSWASKSAGAVGLNIYKWSGSIWYFLLWLANPGFENIYGPAFDQSIASYAIPE